METMKYLGTLFNGDTKESIQCNGSARASPLLGGYTTKGGEGLGKLAILFI